MKSVKIGSNVATQHILSTVVNERERETHAEKFNSLAFCE